MSNKTLTPMETPTPEEKPDILHRLHREIDISFTSGDDINAASFINSTGVLMSRANAQLIEDELSTLREELVALEERHKFLSAQYDLACNDVVERNKQLAACKAELESAEQETDKYKTLHNNMADLAKHATNKIHQVKQENAELRKALEEMHLKLRGEMNSTSVSKMTLAEIMDRITELLKQA